MAKAKSLFNGSLNTGGMLVRLAAVIVAIALAWGSQSAKITAVGEAVNRHMEQTKDDIKEIEADVDSCADDAQTNTESIIAISVMLDNLETAQADTTTELHELRVEQRTEANERRADTQIILKAIDDRSP